MDWYTVFWKQWRIFKKRFWKIFSSSLVNPLLYLIVFGWGLGRNIQVEGGSYMQFVIPGIIAMTTMNTSYNAVANPLNISRIYYKTYEEYIIAPISSFSVVLGEVLAGSGRGMFAGLIVLLLSFLFGVNFQISPLFILIMFVNSFLFASLGVVAAMVIDSHEDMAMFSSFVIVPMALSNTFFSLQMYRSSKLFNTNYAFNPYCQIFTCNFPGNARALGFDFNFTSNCCHSLYCGCQNNFAC